MTRTTKILSITGAIIIVALAVAFYFKFCFVFSEGVAAGELNYFAHKGYIFKTYEGKMIQSGFNAKNTTTAVQSYEFRFSVQDQAVADSLMRCSGKTLELHYQEYLGILPWRGVSKLVVDKIISVRD